MKRFLTICSLLLLLCSIQANAGNFALTTLTNPPQGGTVAGAGTYADGTTVYADIAATNGWYIENATVNPYGGFSQFQSAVVAVGFLNHDDITTITNLTELIKITNNTTLTVTFAPLSPRIITQPTNQVVIIGDTVTLSGAASGRWTIGYQWKKDGQDVSDATGTNLVLNNVQLTNSGSYSLVATNDYGMTNSASATLTVRDFLLYADGQGVLTSAITANDYVLFLLRSRYPNGSIFYTLDGTAPDYTSTYYDGGEFYLGASCTLRAVAYSEDFSQSIYLNPVAITLIRNYDLSTVTDGGGTITIDPLTNHYPANTLVTVVATPDPGWIFMGWSGAITGNAFTNIVTMDRPKHIQATFGTALGTTITGNGTVSVSPPAPLYPFVSTVKLVAVPNPGNYFVRWGNAVSSSQNPLLYTVDTAMPTVSALFASLPANQASLTVVSQGGGAVSLNPSTNRFQIGANATITALPEYGQQFIGWSGDAAGTANPLIVSMTTSKVITARFTRTPKLFLQREGANVSIVLNGVEREIYQIETSTNLSTWVRFCTLTNFFEALRFSDPILPNVPARMYRVTTP